jgi:uncharacterized protein (DUF1501 family)
VIVDRRTFLLGSALLAGLPRLALAAAPTDRRLVVVLLRGGLDGLAAVPVPGDPAFRALRGEVDGAIPLDSTFALHPALAPLKSRWDARELLIFHAACSPYADRSHFDGQNVLENGTATPFGSPSGWLNRALVALGRAPAAVALGDGLPLVLRGAATASNLDPERLPDLPDPLVRAIRSMYAQDDALRAALDRGLDTLRLFEAHAGPRAPNDGAAVLGRVLAADEGPRVAAFEIGGFDTHTSQDQRLRPALDELVQDLEGLRTGLGDAWARTAVLVVTEFGRTAHRNGTDGTDHGVGGVAFALGGAIRGGRVLADWPGLGPDRLLEGRDLRPTTDLRGVFKGILADHLRVPTAALEGEVFPDSARVRPVDGLISA